MTVTFSPAADFADITDGLEAVTLSQRGSTDTAVTNALKRAITTREAAASQGRYTAADVRWHIPIEECVVTPAMGDVIIDGDSVRWTVLEVQKATLESRWACVCRDVAIVAGLDDTIIVDVATYTKGDGGAEEATWRVFQSGVRARIQPDRVEVRIENDARIASKRYLIYADAALDLDQTYRIKDREGNTYTILSITNAERVGEVMTIEAEVSPWPS